MLIKQFILLFLISFSSSLITGCNLNNSPNNEKKKREFKRMPEITLSSEQKGKIKLFILAGQSNMSGRGDINNKNVFNTPSPKILMYGNDLKWRQALEPVDNPVDQIDVVSKDNNAGYGPALSFGETIIKKLPGVTIGLIPCSKGGTTIRQWQKSNDSNSLYNVCLEKVRKALPSGELAALIFQQGESDAWNLTEYGYANPTAHGWGKLFIQFVKDFRNDLGMPNLPLVYAQIGSHDDATQFPNWDIVKNEQTALNIPNSIMTITEDIPLKDYVHYTTEGFEENGRRYAIAYLKLVNKL